MGEFSFRIEAVRSFSAPFLLMNKSTFSWTNKKTHGRTLNSRSCWEDAISARPRWEASFTPSLCPLASPRHLLSSSFDRHPANSWRRVSEEGDLLFGMGLRPSEWTGWFFFFIPINTRVLPHVAHRSSRDTGPHAGGSLNCLLNSLGETQTTPYQTKW